MKEIREKLFCIFHFSCEASLSFTELFHYNSRMGCYQLWAQPIVAKMDNSIESINTINENVKEDRSPAEGKTVLITED